MNKNKRDSLGGLILIIIGAFICLTVGLPFLSSVFAVICGLYLINYGLILRKQSSLADLIQRIFYEIKIRFFS